MISPFEVSSVSLVSSSAACEATCSHSYSSSPRVVARSRLRYSNSSWHASKVVVVVTVNRANRAWSPPCVITLVVVMLRALRILIEQNVPFIIQELMEGRNMNFINKIRIAAQFEACCPI